MRQAMSGGVEAAGAEWGAGLMTQGEDSSLREGCRIANLSMKIELAARTQKIFKMKIDSDKLLKTNGKLTDKMSQADELLKISDLPNLPMSY
jgi:hypothetical protein